MELKTERILVVVTPTELAAFKAEAERIGLKLSTWLRLTARKSVGLMDGDRP